MNAPKAEPDTNDNRPAADLDRRYGRIGISAVAAALTYKGEAKNTVYAPSEERR